MATTHRKPQRPTSVYRYYDEQGLLLYVGITSRGMARNAEHDRTKAWWRYVTSQQVEHYSTRGEAADRERQLIRRYRPPFNTQHNVDPAGTQAAYAVLREVRNEPIVNAPQRKKRSRVLDLTVRCLGPQTLLLSTSTEDFYQVHDLDLSVADFPVGSGGRRARVEVITRSRGVARLRVGTRQAERCSAASLMIRYAQRPGASDLLTIKRLDLNFGKAA